MRVAGWRSALEAALGKHRGPPLEWGVHDCLILAGDAVLAVTGEDPISKYRGAYSTEKQALKLLGKHRDLARALAARYPEIHISQARVGDLALVPTDSAWGMGIGVVMGPTIQVYDARGLAVVPLIGGGNETRRAFRIE